jgi:cytochrome bd-type quinol oxidase subunit 2
MRYFYIIKDSPKIGAIIFFSAFSLILRVSLFYFPMLVSLLILTFKGKARDFREIDDLYQPAF